MNVKKTVKKRAKKFALRSDKGGTHKTGSPNDGRIGNKYWELRELRSNPRVFDSPEELWDYFIDYREWCAENPKTKNEAIKSGQNAGKTFEIKMPRVLTQRGFAEYLGVSSRSLGNYGTKEEYEEYHETTRMIEDQIVNDKFENAMVGNYDPRLAATDLGIKEKKEMQIMPIIQIDKDDAELYGG